MRLLNASTIEFHEFYGDKVPSYAILSHRWGDSEVTFQDLIDGSGHKKAGWEKVKGCCNQAVLDGWEYVWIDSCCIDKSSSAELSEAINSMFAWYERAEVCYAYLSDVFCTGENPQQFDKELRRSRWFTRGWTLQELLAPYYVDFFSQNWTWVGSKSSLEDLISDVTRIRNLWEYKDASVAQKMSWASKRQTTRIEDEAYSLLGLFGVHMPPLYGEGENAFIRLQLEILNKLDDDSIFAWKGAVPWGSSGLLAPSPSNFFSSSNITKANIDPHRPPHRMTSRGLGVQFTLKPEGSDYLALLNCAWDLGQTKSPLVSVGLPLYFSDTDERSCRGATLVPLELDADTRIKLLTNITTGFPERMMHYIPQLSAPVELAFDSIRVVWKSFSSLGFKVKNFCVNEPSKEASWVYQENPEEGPYLHDFAENNSLASITFHKPNSAEFGLLLGISKGRLWVDLRNLQDNESMEDLGALVNVNVVGQDRASRPLLHGSMNVKIYGTRFFRRIVEVSFDPKGTLRWQRWGIEPSGPKFLARDSTLCEQSSVCTSPRYDFRNHQDRPVGVDDWPTTSVPHWSESDFITRPTPISLGWNTEIEHLGLYTFILTKSREPYFELHSHLFPSDRTPKRVYLDQAREQKENSFPCLYPGGCNGNQSTFKRPADLERHYRNFHMENRIDFRCDYDKCPRGQDGFTRKDHFRDHLRDYHKEDIGAAKGPKRLEKDKYQKKQEQWLAERKINSRWWRCVKCLHRCYIATEGWICIRCKISCEGDRQRVREKLKLPSQARPEDVASSDVTFQFCSKCNGSALIKGEDRSWAICTKCQGDAYEIKPSPFLVSAAEQYGYH